MVTMLQDFINLYFTVGTLFGMLISCFTYLLARRYGDFVDKVTKLRRVWLRLTLSFIIAMVMMFTINECGFSYWQNIPAIVIFFLLSSIVCPLPHEYLSLPLIKKDWSKWLVCTKPGKMRYELSKVKKAKMEDQQLAWYNYFLYVREQELFHFEYDKYYYPAIEQLVMMGAIKDARSEIQKVEKDYPNDSYLLVIKACIAYYDTEMEDMRIFLEQAKQLPKKNKHTDFTITLNMLCYANETNDHTLYKKCIEECEDIYFNKKIHEATILHDLMYYYDHNGETEKLNRLIADIKNRKYKSIPDLFDRANTLYSYYRNHNDREGQLSVKKLIDDNLPKMDEYNETHQLYAEIDTLNMLFNINTAWREYRQNLFTYCDKYLNHSLEIAMKFIEEAVKLFRGAHQVYHLSMSPKEHDHLIGKMNEAIVRWKPVIENQLATLPKALLYRRKSLYRNLSEFVPIKNDRNTNVTEQTDLKLRIIDNVIKDCRSNDNVRELLFHLNVYCDEIITQYEQFIAAPPPPVGLPDQEKKIYHERFENYFKPLAVKRLVEMEQIIDRNLHNKAYNFYVLYLAHYARILGDKQKEKFYFHLFRSYQFDVQNYPTVIQHLYAVLEERNMN